MFSEITNGSNENGNKMKMTIVTFQEDSKHDSSCSCTAITQPIDDDDGNW